MINRKLLKALLGKTKVTRQRLSQRAKNIKKEYGPMSTEEATYLIAHKEGLDLDRYLVSSEVDKVRQIVASMGRHTKYEQISQTRPIVKRTTKIVKIGGSFTLQDPILKSSVITEAKEMATKVYPTMYVFENSIRELITRIMFQSYGKNWWNKNVPKDIRNRVRDRIAKEKKRPWHGKSGAHYIYYTDFPDLYIIIVNNWSKFNKIIPTKEWFSQKITELYPTRNIIAHNNPLKRGDIDRLEVYFRDWEEVLREKRQHIP